MEDNFKATRIEQRRRKLLLEVDWGELPNATVKHLRELAGKLKLRTRGMRKPEIVALLMSERDKLHVV